jgi:hypothetical protein
MCSVLLVRVLVRVEWIMKPKAKSRGIYFQAAFRMGENWAVRLVPGIQFHFLISLARELSSL